MCMVAMLYSNGNVSVADADLGLTDLPDSWHVWRAFFEPRYTPSQDEQKFWLKLDPNHQIDMTTRISCNVKDYGNMYSCDSKEDFYRAMLDLYGLDVNKPSIPLR